MGIKGDRASKEPIAMRMYADNKTLTEISKVLNVSITTLSEWKTSTRPNRSQKPEDRGQRTEEVLDEWDRARQQKRSTIQRIRDIYEQQLNYIEGIAPVQRTPAMMDGLSKLGSLVEQWNRAEVNIGSLKMDMFLEFMREMIGYLNRNDREAVPMLERNFDNFIQAAREKYGSQ